MTRKESRKRAREIVREMAEQQGATWRDVLRDMPRSFIRRYAQYLITPEGVEAERLVKEWELIHDQRIAREFDAATARGEHSLEY